MIVGTAGHIDHGKTSLVKALTGVDTDRLKEEKARGITIELGFAYLPRPPRPGDAAGEQIIGFIDVPGHERLVHTMLAGASGIDFVIVVVAADDGVMPQTREHLAIVDLLGLEHGLVAMTKCDLVGAERREEVAAQVRALLAGTGLAGAEIIPVSAVTGEGLPTIMARLEAALATTVARSIGGRYRQVVDRVFALPGAGTVVTGTILSGRVREGDQVALSPSGLPARVRSIHAQGRKAVAATAGERAAVALVGPDISTESVARGDVVLDPTLHAPVRRLDMRLAVLESERKPVSQWMPVHFHHGARSLSAHLVPLSGDSLAPGSSGFVQVVLDAPLAAAVGDRCILRDVASSRTIGGGTILDLGPPERKRRTPERLVALDVLRETDPLTCLDRLLAGPADWVDLAAFCRDRALASSFEALALESLTLTAFQAGAVKAVMRAPRWAAFKASLLELLAAHHQAHPDQPGLGQEKARLGLRPRFPAPVFSVVLATLQAAGDIKLDRGWMRLPQHEVRLSPEEEQAWAAIRPLLEADARFRPPRVRDIAKARNIDEAVVRRLFKLVARRGEVDEIAKDHYFATATVIEMAEIARELARASVDGQFAVNAFRDRLDNGRKVAIQILEFFDAQGLTMRRGDLRRINPHKADLFRPPALSQASGGVGA